MKKTCATLLVIYFIFSCSLFSAVAEETQELVEPVFVGGEEVTFSTWADAEVHLASKYSLLPMYSLREDYGSTSNTVTDYREPITRAQFIRFALSYAAAMNHSSQSTFQRLVEVLLAEKSNGSILFPFTDDYTSEVVVAYTLGMVEGRGNGIFDPNSYITRQEAATLLYRAYRIFDENEEKDHPIRFSDADEISPWAMEAVSALQNWDILRGMEDGCFDPLGNFTIQQCVVCFLRLYEFAPVSRLKGNAPSLFSMDETLEGIEAFSNLSEITLQLDGPLATFLRTDTYGVMIGATRYYLVYQEGGVMNLPEALPRDDLGYPLENVEFSEDGKTLIYTIRLDADEYTWQQGQKTLLYEHGLYHVMIDVESCEMIVTKEA